MPSYRVSITAADSRGYRRQLRMNVRASRPEDAVDIACAHAQVRRDLDPPAEPSGVWHSRSRGVRSLSLKDRRFGTVSRDAPPALSLATTSRS